MNNTKNALAELAKTLKNGYVSLVVNDRHVATFTTAAFPELDKAQRIVAELAKVEDRHDGETNSDVLWRCNDCIAKCRAIAEEGGRNER